MAGDLCCLCGGGAADTVEIFSWISALNTATLFAAEGEIDMLGDRDTYVIYPTTEKSIDRPGFSVAYNSAGNLKNRENECTRVFGFDKQDTLEFRLDDPTVEDHKFTDDDDECAF